MNLVKRCSIFFILLTIGCTTAPPAKPKIIETAVQTKVKIIKTAPPVKPRLSEIARNGNYIAYSNNVAIDTKARLEWVAGPDREVESREMMAALEEAIGNLPEHYRIIVVLRHQEQLSYEEISDNLGIPLGTVKARIHRARNMIKDFFKQRGLLEDPGSVVGD